MKITIYGKDVVIKIFLITIVIDIFAFLIPNLLIKILLLVFSILIFGFTLFFFRDPERKIPKDLKENLILSPADGKVVIIKDTKLINDFFNLTEYNLKQISIFLSPLNVHVNRIPLTGMVTYYKYFSGKFLMAFNHKSSEFNERTEIGIENNGKKLLFKQIAGFIARRIVCKLKVGDNCIAGDRFGMIKFGSRIDIFLSSEAKIFVKPDQKVKAGITVIAEI